MLSYRLLFSLFIVLSIVFQLQTGSTQAIEYIPPSSYTPPPSDTAPSTACGNSILESLEQCDDGNTIDGDGCSSTCQIEGRPPLADTTTNTNSNVCGNGVCEVPEQCDLGNENGPLPKSCSYNCTWNGSY